MRPFFALLFLFVSWSLTAQPSDTTGSLRVGVVARAPHAMQDASGNWSGLAVALWRRVAERERLRYELVEVQKQDSLLPLVGQRVDVLLQAPVTANGTREVTYLQPYQQTTLAVACPKRNSIWRVVRNLFTMQFFRIVLALSALLMLIGTAIYFLERGQNDEQFGGERSLAEGIGSGFWWAGVTLTTIGYGDKAPQTLGGRIVAMLWMLTALALTASLTAAVVSALNQGSTVSFPDDLKEQRVGATANTQATDYLDERGVAYQSFETAADGLQQLNRGELDYYVDNHTALRYALANDKALAADVQPTDVRPQAQAIAVDTDSPLRDQLDAAVVRVTLSESWRGVLRQYGGMEE